MTTKYSKRSSFQKEYEKTEGVRIKFAYLFSDNREDFEDLICEANYIFVRCWLNYRGDAEFFSYYYTSARDGLKSYISRRKNSRLILSLEELTDSMVPAYEMSYYPDIWELPLSSEAFLVIHSIFYEEIDLISSPKRKITKQSLEQYLKKTYDWSPMYSRNVFQEISQTLEKIIR